jgi:hypothetical protein
MSCQVATDSAVSDASMPFRIHSAGQKSNPPTSAIGCRRFRGNRQLFRSGWQVPHLIGRGHSPGHSLDQLLRDWLKSDVTAVPFCPDLRMKWHKLMLLNTIVIWLGVKGSQVQILSARRNKRPA